MFTLVAFSLFLTPQPAYFVFVVDSNTEVAVFLNNNLRITPGKVYKIAPFVGTLKATVKIRFLNGSETITETATVIFTAGKFRKITITVRARPPTAVRV